MAAAVLPYIDALEQTFGATAEVGATLSPQEWELPTECPGWTVKDVLSHLVTFEAAALGRGAGRVPHAGRPAGRAAARAGRPRRGPRGGHRVLGAAPAVAGAADPG